MNIVITGASRGIGFDAALALAANTSNTVIAIARSAEGLQRLAKAALDKGLMIDTYQADLTTLDATGLEAIFARYAHIDILLNNAGMLVNKPFTDTTIAEWRTIFDTNVFSQLNLIQLLLPRLAKSGAAHIVNIGSMGGYQGSSKFVGLSAYSASKAALANITECLAEELKPMHIKVNCLALGAVNTEMLAAAFPGYEAPVGSAEMAAFIADFALNGHKYFNGKILPVAVSTP